jgi:hypothetical protein
MRTMSALVRCGAVALVATLLTCSAPMSPSARAATQTSDLPPLSVTQLIPAVTSTVSAVDLDDANRALVNVDNGATVSAYVTSGTSFTTVADYRAVAFSTIGSPVISKDVVVGNRGSDGNGWRAFVTVDGLEQEILWKIGEPISIVVNDVNRSGTVVGQFQYGNVTHAFSITPLDDDKDGVPDTWSKDDDPQDNVNDLFHDLGGPDSGPRVATAINDNGIVVGIWYDGLVWRPFNSGGEAGARPNDISNNNEVVGLNTTTQRALLFPSTVLDESGSFGNTAATSINNHTQVVGIGGTSGFYYDPDHGITNTNDRIVDPNDRWSFSPAKINDSGVILASASNRAFLLTPAPTCTSALDSPQRTGTQPAACCTVTDVSWQDNRLTSNPAALGGGQKVFADKNSPSDPSDGRDITVAATAPTGSTVYFRVFDVDDPTSDTSPVDAKGPVGDDNRGHLDPLPASAISDSSGHARVALRMSTHPGDNFRVAAGCDHTYLDTLAVSKTDIVDTGGATLPTATAKVTSLLTVWRRIHIERDDMTAVKGNQTLGTITTMDRSRTKLTVGSLRTSDGTTLRRLEAGRYENGTIDWSTGAAVVGSNTASVVTLHSPVPAGINPVGRSFTMVDDDDYLSVGGLLTGDEGQPVHAIPGIYDYLQSSDDPTKNPFAAAYIEPSYDGGGNASNDSSVPFRLHLPLNTASAAAAVDRSRGSAAAESDSYWIAYFLHGYQPARSRDHDPSSEVGTAGSTWASAADAETVVSEATVPKGGNDCILYMEAIREAATLVPQDLQRTVPHELGHQFGLKHWKTTDSLMSKGSTGAIFVPAELNALRWRVKSPGQ